LIVDVFSFLLGLLITHSLAFPKRSATVKIRKLKMQHDDCDGQLDADAVICHDYH